MKEVKYIPQKRNVYSNYLINGERKKKVCAYARVSTDFEDQKNSFEAQQDYYKKYISENNEWDYYGLYTDEGISGLSTNNRNGFNKMIFDATNHKFDLIITKSVSRFARNTIDSLRIIRELKNKGIEIYFEKENIWTFSENGEILLTLMSSFAQEESRSISENVLWAKKRMMEKGKFALGYSTLLGYEKGENGLKINEQQASIVKLIFDLFLDGLNSIQIKNELEAKKILSPLGLSKWNSNTILNILRNEKYKGDMILQKYYTKDFISKKIVKNKGVKPRYYIENNHEAIIDSDTFDYVQYLLNEVKVKKCSNQLFSNKIYCGYCNTQYKKRNIINNNDSNLANYYCKHNSKQCNSISISEKLLINKTIESITYLLKNKTEIISKDLIKIDKLSTSTEYKDKILKTEINIFVIFLKSMESQVTELSKKLINRLIDKIFVYKNGILIRFLDKEEIFI